MTGVRTLPCFDQPTEDLIELKASRSVSVCIPCRNEASTIGALVDVIRQRLMDDAPIVDELVVLDDRSSDDSAAIAADSGATVVPIDRIHADHGVGRGKGNALWASLLATTGDIVTWIDGDLTSFEPTWITRLIAPLLADGSINLVKASSRRPTSTGDGGRTTELVARPLISLYFPDLSDVRQPLAGEYAARRDVLEQLPFVTGWGVEIALLIDISRRYGADSISQVDVGIRRHRHRSLDALSVQAAEVMATMLSRAGIALDAQPSLQRLDQRPIELELDERPPVSTVRR